MAALQVYGVGYNYNGQLSGESWRLLTPQKLDLPGGVATRFGSGFGMGWFSQIGGLKDPLFGVWNWRCWFDVMSGHVFCGFEASPLYGRRAQFHHEMLVSTEDGLIVARWQAAIDAMVTMPDVFETVYSPKIHLDHEIGS